MRLIQQVMLLSPFIFGGYLIKYYFSERDDYKEIQDGYFYVLLSGIIGSRITYVLFHIDSYRDNWGRIFHISQYNLSFIGGIGFSIGALFLLNRWRKLKGFGEYFTLFYMVLLFKNLISILSNIIFPDKHSILSSECAFMLLIVYLIAWEIDRRLENKHLARFKGILFILTIVLAAILRNTF